MKTALRVDAIPLLLLSAAISLSMAEIRTTATRSAEPRTVRDYFLLVPERYIGYDRRFREELLGGNPGAVVDIRNGYISYRATDNPESFEFALFRKSNSKYLIAFSVGFDPDFPETTSKLLLLDYENGKWSDVTAGLLPVAFDRRLTYRLPRRGRKIIVTDERGREVYTLTWINDKFSIDRAKNR